jgi:hypothetical protein
MKVDRIYSPHGDHLFFSTDDIDDYLKISNY